MPSCSPCSECGLTSFSLMSADAIEQRQADRADTGVELDHPRTRRDLRAHMFNDELREIEIALAERARRIVHGRPAKMFDNARRPPPTVEIGTENAVGAFGIGVEPQAVQILTEPLANEIQTRRQRAPASLLLATMST